MALHVALRTPHKLAGAFVLSSFIGSNYAAWQHLGVDWMQTNPEDGDGSSAGGGRTTSASTASTTDANAVAAKAAAKAEKSVAEPKARMDQYPTSPTGSALYDSDVRGGAVEAGLGPCVGQLAARSAAFWVLFRLLCFGGGAGAA